MNHPPESGSIFHKIFLNESNHSMVQLFRYLIAGGTAFLVDYLTLVTLTELLRIPYLISAAIAFSMGLTIIYILTISWVFSAGKQPRKEIVIFFLTGVTGLLLNELILYIATDWLTIDYRISKLISTGVVFFWNFFSRKLLIGYQDRTIENK